MNCFRETVLLLRNTAIVTFAVILGLTVCGVTGVPGWLYYRLSGGAPPVWWKWAGLLAGVSGLLFVVTHVHEPYQEALGLMFVMAPVQRVTKWLERRFTKTPKNESQSKSP